MKTTVIINRLPDISFQLPVMTMTVYAVCAWSADLLEDYLMMD